ncbi:multiple PDZ domain protein isoform X4 [Aedes aegypti]|uniref:PDZ domain-containing protein n=1 Tax=Aedes aegypti TaxID=7159 RepID=A0A6I8TQR7_AEDAE|nr:multiple PDZ domain protein isoform X4 [Aedes aegypti]
MIRFTSYSSDDSLFHRDLSLFKGYLSHKRFVKYVTSNEYENILVLNNIAFKPYLLRYLYTKLRQNLYNGRYMLHDISADIKPKSKFSVTTSIRKEYFNDINVCLKDLEKLGNHTINDTTKDDPSLYECYEDEMDSITFPKRTETTLIISNPADMLSSNESTVFLDAIGDDYESRDIHDSDDDTMKSLTKTSISRTSLDSISVPHIEVLVENAIDSATKDPSTMTVMALENQDVLCDDDWGKERDVVVIRDEEKSFGISIVGGTVNVSDDSIVSGIFIKNIIPNSPADKCGLLKIADEEDNLESIPKLEDEIISKDTSKLSVKNETPTHRESDSGPEEDSSDDEDARDLEGKTYTKAGIEIDRASAGNIKRTKEEISLDTDEEDSFGYTARKIKKKYSALGNVLHHSIDRSCGSSLGISLAGHRDRTKMACFIAGINPKGAAAAAPFEIGDEILEVNGLVLHGRSHLNVPTIIKGLEGTSLKFIVLRRKNAMEELAVKPVTQFPVCIDEEDEIFSTYKNVRIVSIKKAASGLGIMIIEGKHAEVGQGIFISDIQEGSMADKAGLNIGEMILSVNKDSLLGCSYEAAASLLKKTEGVITLKICNPNKGKEATDANSNHLDPKQPNTASGKSSPILMNDATALSRPVTPKPQASPVKEIIDPSKAEVISNENSTIEIVTDKSPLGISVVGGSDSRINISVRC